MRVTCWTQSGEVLEVGFDGFISDDRLMMPRSIVINISSRGQRRSPSHSVAEVRPILGLPLFQSSVLIVSVCVGNIVVGDVPSSSLSVNVCSLRLGLKFFDLSRAQFKEVLVAPLLEVFEFFWLSS